MVDNGQSGHGNHHCTGYRFHEFIAIKRGVTDKMSCRVDANFVCKIFTKNIRHLYIFINSTRMTISISSEAFKKNRKLNERNKKKTEKGQ